MAEVIDLVAYLRRQKLIKFMTEGVKIDLDPQMLAEFQYHLECFLSEKHQEVRFFNEGDGELEVRYLDETFMTFHFLDGFFYMTVTSDCDLDDYDVRGRVGVIASDGFFFWEAFEKEIPFIQQSFL